MLYDALEVMILNRNSKGSSSKSMKSKKSRKRKTLEARPGGVLLQRNSEAGFREPTIFEHRVYDYCATIPLGKVTSYGAIARALDSSPRAVGQALRKNPYAPRVPCHRVISSSMMIGGFSGHMGIKDPIVRRKIVLLESEGVEFDAQGKLKDPKECFLA